MSFSRVCSAGVYHPVSIRIASHGHASTHCPQKMHRSMSMSNRTGYFSTFGSGDSPATIVMHLAGQAGPEQPPEPGGHHPPHLRVLDRGDVLLAHDVAQKVPHRHPEPLDDLDQVESLRGRHLPGPSDLDDPAGHPSVTRLRRSGETPAPSRRYSPATSAR